MTGAAATLAERIDVSRDELAREATERHFRARPELQSRFGSAGRARCIEDAKFHLSYLAAAISLDAPEVFTEYLLWGVATLASRGIGPADLIADMAALEGLLAERFAAERRAIEAFLGPARAALEHAPASVPEPALSADAARYFDSARRDPLQASALVDELIAAGMPVPRLYVDVLAPAMQEAGRRWQANTFSVADEHYFTAVTQRMMTKAHSAAFTRRARGPRVVVACVGGELHELGARMVSDLLELQGYRALYLGASMPARAIVDFAAVRQASVLALSASLAPHVREVGNVIQIARHDPRCAELRVIVGGRAFSSPTLWRALGADGWAQDAAAGCTEVQRLVPLQ